MEGIVQFLANNYLWFLIITIILIFALIGYLVDTSEQPNEFAEIKNNDSSVMNVEPVSTEVLKEEVLDATSSDATTGVEQNTNITQ